MLNSDTSDFGDEFLGCVCFEIMREIIYLRFYHGEVECCSIDEMFSCGIPWQIVYSIAPLHVGADRWLFAKRVVEHVFYTIVLLT